MASVFTRAAAFVGPVLLVALAYWLGHNHAEAKGRAEMLALKIGWEEERRENAEAYGKALADALERSRREMERANAVTAAYAENRKKHAREADALKRRIRHVAANSSHFFSSDFVRLYNEAIGLSGDALSQALCALGPAGEAGTAGTSGAGQVDLFSGVSEADLLEHMVRYGQRCRKLEAQVTGWQDLEKTWQ